MTNTIDITQFREGNRYEAKLAKRGLPNSIWETYSAFANTDGGLILLGVKENKDHSFTVEGVDNPEPLIKNFWDIVNNQNKVSINLLLDKHVYTKEIEGKLVIFIEVPRAERQFRPEINKMKASLQMRTFIISEIEKVSNQTGLKVSLLLPPAGISRSKWYEWKTRSGQETRHNANVPKNGWLLPWERNAIIAYCEANKDMFRGYRYLAWDLFEGMKEYNIELLITRAKELYPDARPRIIHDNGKQYVGEDFKKLLALLEIADSRTRPFHPQSNGKVERFHRPLKPSMSAGHPMFRPHTQKSKWRNGLHGIIQNA